MLATGPGSQGFGKARMAADNDDGGGHDHKLNGHRPTGVMSGLFSSSATLPQTLDLEFDVDVVLRGVVGLSSQVPDDARTAPHLGTEREGHGVLIGDDGLVVTIGYLVMEAESVTLTRADGRLVPARILAYDYDTGFGLVRAEGPLDAPPVAVGESATLKPREAMLVAGAGGRSNAIGAVVVDRREFAGYWEYLLNEAIFTAPPYANWGGAALLDGSGHLMGIGSLFVADAMTGERQVPGNMFVPIDLLKPVLPELLAYGRSRGSDRPWLGIFTSDQDGQFEIVQLSTDGPGALAGLRPGDLIVKVGGRVPADLAQLYRIIWSLGPAGVEVPMTVLRDDRALEFRVRSMDRYVYLRGPDGERDG